MNRSCLIGLLLVPDQFVSAAEAKQHACSRAGRFKELATGGFDRLREYEYWNGFIREEVLDVVCTGDGRVMTMHDRHAGQGYAVLA